MKLMCSGFLRVNLHVTRAETNHVFRHICMNISPSVDFITAGTKGTHVTDGFPSVLLKTVVMMWSVACRPLKKKLTFGEQTVATDKSARKWNRVRRPLSAVFSMHGHTPGCGTAAECWFRSKLCAQIESLTYSHYRARILMGLRVLISAEGWKLLRSELRAESWERENRSPFDTRSVGAHFVFRLPLCAKINFQYHST